MLKGSTSDFAANLVGMTLWPEQEVRPRGPRWNGSWNLVECFVKVRDSLTIDIITNYDLLEEQGRKEKKH